MTDQQDAQPKASPKKQKPILHFGMVWIGKFNGVVIKEHRLGFFKTHPMFPFIGSILLFIPREP